MINSEIDFNKKSQEISYVVFRIGFTMRRTEFRARIERLALDLVESVTLCDFERSVVLIDALECLVQIGASLYEVETVNAHSLLHELSLLQSAIRQRYAIYQPFVRQESATVKKTVADDAAIGNGFADESAIESANEEDRTDEGMISIASTIRQSAILDKVRSMTSKNESTFLSGCRMKDLLLAFPQVSERTLRYDLQHLLERGTIERLGSGGSNSFYVIK